MSSVCKTTFATALFILTVSSKAFSQFSNSKYEVGLNVGTLIYQGDLSRSPVGDYKSLHPALGLFVARSLDRYFSLRGNLVFGKVTADETDFSSPAWKKQRAFKFGTPITELSSTLVFNLLGGNSSENFHRLSPYLFAGAGLTFLHIKRDWSGIDRNVFDSKSKVAEGLAVDSAHALPGVIPVLPVGAGVRFQISSQWSLNAEATYRFTTTDYLDGFKYAGNEKRRDAYYGLSLGLSYRFGGYKCPTVK
jgi:opacity protein-like surface antigen